MNSHLCFFLAWEDQSDKQNDQLLLAVLLSDGYYNFYSEILTQTIQNKMYANYWIYFTN